MRTAHEQAVPAVFEAQDTRVGSRPVPDNAIDRNRSGDSDNIRRYRGLNDLPAVVTM